MTRDRRPDNRRSPQLFADVVAARLSRRELLEGSVGLAALSFLGCGTQPAAAPQARAPAQKQAQLLGFTQVPVSKGNQIVVPPGYGAQVLLAWGDPLSDGPAFRNDASNSAEDQASQAGMGHDGMRYFPLPAGSSSSDHGLLAMNYEYTDDGLLHPDGFGAWSAEKVQKSKNAHGIGVVEVRLAAGRWRVVRPSRHARRITADTPIQLRGPAAGHPLLQTALDPTGKTVLGTFNNCACGYTPWGTYLSCEENVAPYFVARTGKIAPALERYGIGPKGWGFRWEEFDPRFDASQHPNEPNRHGWVVEIDPYDPSSPPVKRTALGRMGHEGATLALTKDNRVVYYMGDDDFRSLFEHIYKFVSARPYTPGGGRSKNDDVLDHGTLYAARFDADGTGEWIELTQGKNGLLPDKGFGSQAEVLIHARLAADAAGATFMDRPEWLAVHPRTGEVYCTLTNNTKRGKQGELGPDAANPRGPNLMGHILRFREEGNDPAATRFTWDIFLQAGDPESSEESKRGNVRGGAAFAQPDGLVFDARGVLWIHTDSSAKLMATPDWARIGNNQLLAADPATGEVRRFLTGVVGCELTGAAFTPDGTTMFLNVQHPGELPQDHPPRNDPANPKAASDWPDGPDGGRPRSATIAVRRDDGGAVGA
ncbi:PhoX family protein [Sorangium sp. So ce1128]